MQNECQNSISLAGSIESIYWLQTFLPKLTGSKDLLYRDRKKNVRAEKDLSTGKSQLGKRKSDDCENA